MPPKRGRPRGSTTSKLHFSNHQKSDSKKRKSFDSEMTPVKRSPQGKKNNNANDSKVILKYDGINITKKDKDTLRQGEFLSDTIISLGFALCESENKEEMCNKNIVLVRPEMAHLLKNADRPRVRQQMKALGIL